MNRWCILRHSNLELFGYTTTSFTPDYASATAHYKWNYSRSLYVSEQQSLKLALGFLLIVLLGLQSILNGHHMAANMLQFNLLQRFSGKRRTRTKLFVLSTIPSHSKMPETMNLVNVQIDKWANLFDLFLCVINCVFVILIYSFGMPKLEYFLLHCVKDSFQYSLCVKGFHFGWFTHTPWWPFLGVAGCDCNWWVKGMSKHLLTSCRLNWGQL